MKPRKIVYIDCVLTDKKNIQKTTIALNTVSQKGHYIVVNALRSELSIIETAIENYGLDISHLYNCQQHKSMRTILTCDKFQPHHQKKGTNKEYVRWIRGYSKNQSKMETAFIIPVPLRKDGCKEYPYVNASAFAEYVSYCLDKNI